MQIIDTSYLTDIWGKFKKIYILIGGVIIGAIAATTFSVFLPDAAFKEVRSPASEYKFINPLLECQNVSFENNSNLNSLKREVKESVDEAISQGKIANASVYYRDLNVGPRFDVNRDDMYTPASLIKVPLMIALYKVSETDPSIMQKTVTVDQDYNYDNQNFKPQRFLEKGKTYTLKELMKRMIIDSDNFAYDLILANIDQEVLVRVYNDLDIDILKLNAEDPDGDILSVKDYPGFFRVLFNASYLTRQHSEEALELLSRSAFDKGLVAGTPEETVVSHKYGERFFSFSGIYQLHDCGIVYNKKSPYLLCIMTKGDSFKDLEDFIQSTTRMIDEAHTNTP